AEGYEIRHGRTQPHPGLPPPQVALRNATGEAIGWQAGRVLGLYAHGLFEQPAVLQALFGQTGRPLDAVFDGLADFIDLHFQPGRLASLIA
ncbi:MAG: cobyric acid synthase CobQ, partial [Rubrivivax sp.]